MHLDLTDLHVQARVDAVEERWLKSYLTWRTGRGGSVTKCLLAEGKFPAGLANVVARAARAGGLAVTGKDTRECPVCETRLVPEKWLRPYQAEAVRKCLDPKRPLPGRGILSMPTGAGKTRTFSALVWSVRCRWLILVDTKHLLDQTAAEFEALTGEKAGRCGDGVWEPGRVTVATVQTLHRSLGTKRVRDLLLQAQGVVVDEVHTAAADSFVAVLAATPAYWRLGFSATPLGREDKADLVTVGATGPVIYTVPRETLVALGVITDAEITFWSYEQESAEYWAPVTRLLEAEDNEGAWAEAYRLGVVLSPKRNAKLVELAKLCAKPGLMFVHSIEHGEALLGMLSREGLRVDFVHGAHHRDTRRYAVRRLNDGDLDILICSKIFNKGVDIPAVHGMVNAAALKAYQDLMQKIGRTLRGSAGKRVAEVHDVADEGPFLKGHTTKRIKAYERAGYEVRRL